MKWNMEIHGKTVITKQQQSNLGQATLPAEKLGIRDDLVEEELFKQ